MKQPSLLVRRAGLGARFALAVAVAGCSAQPPLGAAAPRWQQRADEAGLPVGRVVAVERLATEEPPALTKPGAAGPATGVQVDTIALVRAAARKPDVVFRHTVRLRSGATEEVDDEIAFAVGDCVALRPGAGGALPVAALPGACD